MVAQQLLLPLHGVDVRTIRSAADFDRRVRQPWLANGGVLLLRGQSPQLTSAQLVAFSRFLGKLDIHVAEQFLLPGQPEVLQITNRRNSDGSPMGFEEAGRYWHSDMSYLVQPVMASVMHAKTVPPTGGDTLFSDMYRAYETLDATTIAQIEVLQAAHSYAASFSEANGKGGADLAQLRASAEANGLRAVHPVVRTHPETGRRALYVNRGFTTHVVGMDTDESTKLLEFLFTHCEREDNVRRHQWCENDIVIWDNRCVCHHALAFPNTEVRHMHRTTVKGDKPYVTPVLEQRNEKIAGSKL